MIREVRPIVAVAAAVVVVAVATLVAARRSFVLGAL